MQEKSPHVAKLQQFCEDGVGKNSSTAVNDSSQVSAKHSVAVVAKGDPIVRFGNFPLIAKTLI